MAYGVAWLISGVGDCTPRGLITVTNNTECQRPQIVIVPSHALGKLLCGAALIDVSRHLFTACIQYSEALSTATSSGGSDTDILRLKAGAVVNFLDWALPEAPFPQQPPSGVFSCHVTSCHVISCRTVLL